MGHPLDMALAALLLAPPAAPTDTLAYARLPECRLNAAGTGLAVEPCRTAPARKPMPRRPVPQVITPTPRMARPADPSLVWTPVLTPPGRVALPPPGSPTAPGSSAAPLPGPGAPQPVTCSAGGCRDANGNFYNGIPGGAVVSPGGKVCTNNGVWMQCL